MLELVLILALVGLLTLWVLLPLVPAVLIYRYFPATPVSVGGPLAGLTVKASGAFAAYLVVFIVSTALVQPIKNFIILDSHPFWTIHAHLDLKDTKGKKILNADKLFSSVALSSNDLFIHQGNSLTMRIPEVEGRLPEITIRLDKFGTKNVDPGAARAKIDSLSRIRTLSEPIEIEQIDPQETPDSLASVSSPSPLRGSF